MREDETEQNRRWVEQWKITGPLLEKMKTEELRAMTEEEGRRIAERVMRAVPPPKPDANDSSGLVEQQRWFQKMREC